jgi:hypothetical protein
MDLKKLGITKEQVAVVAAKVAGKPKFEACAFIKGHIASFTPKQQKNICFGSVTGHKHILGEGQFAGDAETIKAIYDLLGYTLESAKAAAKEYERKHYAKDPSALQYVAFIAP